MEIIGHRGARAEAPENTLEAIRVAKQAGVDMIEIDVRFDGKRLVLSHDELRTDRTYTTLAEALNVVDDTPLNIEIKEERVVPLLQDYLEGHSGPIVLSSFAMSVLVDCKTRYPHIQRAVLESWSGVRATYRARKIGTRRIHMNQRWLWRGFIASMTKRGWLVYAYTVNSQRQADIFKKAGLNGIFTDQPTRFMSYYTHTR